MRKPKANSLYVMQDSDELTVSEESSSDEKQKKVTKVESSSDSSSDDGVSRVKPAKK
jgi:hypothetical protein